MIPVSAFSQIILTPASVEENFYPVKTCSQGESRVENGYFYNYTAAPVTCDTSAPPNGPPLGLTKIPYVGWYEYMKPTGGIAYYHKRLYYVFDIDDDLVNVTPKSVTLSISKHGLGYTGTGSGQPKFRVYRTAENQGLEEVYNWESGSTILPVPVLPATASLFFPEYIEFDTNISGDTYTVDITSLYNYFRMLSLTEIFQTGTTDFKMVLALTIVPENSLSGDNVYLSGTGVEPVQALANKPVLKVAYSSFLPVNGGTCGDGICQSTENTQNCQMDCVNGLGDNTPPRIKFDITGSCRSINALNNQLKANNIAGTIKPKTYRNSSIIPGNVNQEVTDFYQNNQDNFKTCSLVLDTDVLNNYEFTIPIEKMSRDATIMVEITDNRRIYQTDITMKNMVNSVTQYSNYVITKIPIGPNKFDFCDPGRVEVRAYDYNGNQAYLKVDFVSKGDGQAPEIISWDPQDPDKLIYINYDKSQSKYWIMPGDDIHYDFSVRSLDAIKEFNVYLDGELLEQFEVPYSSTPTSCRTDPVTSNYYGDLASNYAFGDNLGWQSSGVGHESMMRDLIFEVIDIEGNVSTKTIPLYLYRDTREDAWDTGDQSHSNRKLRVEQEGFFVNFANGSGRLWTGFFDNIDWEDLTWLADMYAETYDFYSGWSTTQLLVYLFWVPVYATVLTAMPAWCTGFSITFNEWKNGSLQGDYYGSCKKKDENNNDCSSSSQYCHWHCCKKRSSDNKCLDNLTDNDLMRHIGAMQGKTLTGEFLGHCLSEYVAFNNSVGLRDLYEKIKPKTKVNDHEVNGNYVISMFDGTLAHSIAPLRVQELYKDAAYRVYVYDPNREELSYGLRCIRTSSQLDDFSFPLNCGEYNKGTKKFINYADFPLTKADKDQNVCIEDSIGGKFREHYNYILLEKSKTSGDYDYYYFDYDSAYGSDSFVIFSKPKTYDTVPISAEGYAVMLFTTAGDLIENFTEEVLGISFDEIDEWIDEGVSLVKGIWDEFWGAVKVWDKKSSNKVVIPLPSFSKNTKIFFPITAAAKRVRVTRQVREQPYLYYFQVGGFDAMVLNGIKSESVETDMVEFYPGFHKGVFELKNIKEKVKFSYTSYFNRQRRTKSGVKVKTTDGKNLIRKELFLVNFTLTPTTTLPKIEFEYLEDGDSFVITNHGSTDVNFDVTIMNSFEAVDSEKVDWHPKTGNRYPRKELKGQLLKSGSATKVTIKEYWNIEGSEVTVKNTLIENYSEGCSCQIGKTNSKTNNIYFILAIFALLWRRRLKHAS